MAQNNNIKVKNIYYMLCYVIPELTFKDYEYVGEEEFTDMQDLFAEILKISISKQLKQGLYREYVDVSSNLPVLRGSLNVMESFRHALTGRKLLSCEYDELSVNNQLNRILLTTIKKLSVSDKVENKRRFKLKEEIKHFYGVDEIDPGVIPWTSLRFHRGNQTYYMMIMLCKFVLEDLLPANDDDKYKMRSFINDDNMAMLYQKFVFEYYRRHFSNRIEVSSPRIKWTLDDGENPFNFLPDMKTDIVLSKNDKILIIDTKYYTHVTRNSYNKEEIDSHNLYQIFSYVKNKQAEYKEEKTVSGMLLYAHTDDPNQPDITCKMMGNRIAVRTLDLNVEFGKIAEQLNNIAEEFLEVKTIQG